jgi:hypothetical protein
MASDLGRRCPMGCETWPADEKYKHCPICGEGTRLSRGVAALDPEEARIKKAYADFESYYNDIHEPDLRPLTVAECQALNVPA